MRATTSKTPNTISAGVPNCSIGFTQSEKKPFQVFAISEGVNAMTLNALPTRFNVRSRLCMLSAD